MSTATAEEIARRYGLEPIPENVMKLTKLVAEQNSDMDEIAKIIGADESLTNRLLRAANPRTDDPLDYGITNVDDALMRTGMGCALLLAMGDPLLRALLKTFDTMMGVKLRAVPNAEVMPLTEEHVLGQVDFEGKAIGQVGLRLSSIAAKKAAAIISGLSVDDLTDDADVDDVIGELGNIVVGNFKSNLCDAGLQCKLGTPSIQRTDDFALNCVSGGLAERNAFHSEQMTVFCDVSVNPWGDDL